MQTQGRRVSPAVPRDSAGHGHRDLMVLVWHAVAWSNGLECLVLVCVLGLIAAFLFLRRRPAALIAVAAAMVLVAGLALGLRFWIASRVGFERFHTLQAMAARPNDPWPRGSGHVPLGLVGASPRNKAYIEPGGGFSPSAGSFGVSFWVLDPTARRIATSDDIPLSQTQQSYGETARPSIAVATPYYRATWQILDGGKAGLELFSPGGPQHLEVVFRSVGPAGGPVREIARLPGGQFLINDRWRIVTDGRAQVTYLGAERHGWLKPQSPAAGEVRDRAGWGALRLSVPAGVVTHLEILDSHGPPLPAVPIEGRSPQPRLPGIDKRFDASLVAQAGTLGQAIIGDEIAPGDPLNYPLPWLRDGAYVLVAMARAGEVEHLRSLATPFAKRDFFGGFGAEADAPGLALWALGDVSVALNDPTFDQSIWPDVVRKVGIIHAMIRAKTPILADFSGPVVPKLSSRPDLRLVAEPARDGLIVGRMDWHRPVFYVNAMSFAGLQSASAIANRLGHKAEAKAWGDTALSLETAWRRRLVDASRLDPQTDDDRTAISGLWPSEIADPAPYRDLLERRWARNWDQGRDAFRTAPLWTYFTVGEAHQWLRLNRPDRVWSVLSWFWDHQPAPGLYTLWEGDGEENSFGIWRTTRGWVQPSGVTPHYWSAAEMLLLQLAMIAEVQGSSGSATLVIGAGVPSDWLRRPFSVAGIGTAAGPVGWSWDGRSVVVHTRSQLPVRLGPAFPAGSEVRVVVREDLGFH